MRNLFYSVVKKANKKIKKGDIRNTVLRQTNAVEEAIELLNQGKEIKFKEVSEYDNKDKSKSEDLKKQVNIIESGLKHLRQAVEELNKYKNTSVT